MAKVMVAMSGGVDSSVAAARLREQGHEVLGVTMHLLDLPESSPGDPRCGAAPAVQQAAAVCAHLGLPHHILDFMQLFSEEVIVPFIEGYRRGLTPNPCLRCNVAVKWGKLWEAAERLGCQYLATGHYARLEKRGERWCLRRGVDRAKDQSYVLYGLSQEALAHTLLPLGEMTKQQVREQAAQLDLPTAATRESQDICFIPGGDYRAFLRDKIPFQPGTIVDQRGEVLGEHEGLPAYTVGQRRGLGLGGGQPLFVLALDVDNNRLVVGPRAALVRREVIIEEFNWVCAEPLPPGESLTAEVELRYRGRSVPAEIRALSGGRVHLHLAEHAQAVTPGQAAVFYEGDRLLGGGIIEALRNHRLGRMGPLPHAAPPNDKRRAASLQDVAPTKRKRRQQSQNLMSKNSPRIIEDSFVLPGTEIEIVNPDLPRGPKPYALFDFDGTLSLIREGWQEVMIPLLVELLEPYARPDETREDLYELVREFVTVLTGKQTIYQMMRLAEEIEKRGGQPLDPLEYKHQYLDRLWERIKDRVAGLKSGKYQPEDLLVPGSLDILENLRSRGVTIFVASGTDQPYVLDEAASLGVDRYTGENIYGAVDDYKTFSKAMVIQRIIEENDLHGSQFLGVGDGYVEIENTKEVGGVAIGAAINEKERRGVDQWKRQRLIGVGADIIVPDFREQETLIAYLWGEM